MHFLALSSESMVFFFIRAMLKFIFFYILFPFISLLKNPPVPHFSISFDNIIELPFPSDKYL